MIAGLQPVRNRQEALSRCHRSIRKTLGWSGRRPADLWQPLSPVLTSGMHKISERVV